MNDDTTKVTVVDFVYDDDDFSGLYDHDTGHVWADCTNDNRCGAADCVKCNRSARLCNDPECQDCGGTGRVASDRGED